MVKALIAPFKRVIPVRMRNDDARDFGRLQPAGEKVSRDVSVHVDGFEERYAFNSCRRETLEVLVDAQVEKSVAPVNAVLEDE